jgi:hypothetical protein
VGASQTEDDNGGVPNVIENRARVELQPLSPLGPGPSEGWRVGQVQVEVCDSVEGYPNLLGSDLPRKMEALIPADVVDQLSPGQRWTVEASLVAPGRLRVERIAS